MADAPNDKQGAPKRLEQAEPAGYFKGESMTRRAAFTVAGQAVGGAAGLIVALPAIGFAVAPLFEEEGDIWQGVGPASAFDSESYRTVVIAAVEGIGDAGRTTAYVRRKNPEIDQEGENEFVAISTRCAHLGCPVRFVQAAGNFICPCHGGVYDFEGKVIGGPPVRPLDRFQTRFVDSSGEVVENRPPRPTDNVEVGPRYSVTSQLDPVRARDPGEFTGGIWEYLYPPRPSVPPPP